MTHTDYMDFALYFSLLGLQSIVISLSVCAFGLSARVTRTYETFCECWPLLWLGPLLTALRYIAYF